MPKYVQGPDGKINEFPDGVSDAQISAALQAIPKVNAPNAPKARTWTDLAVDAIPAVTGTAGAVIGGLGGTAFGFGVGGVPGAAGGAALGAAGGEAAKQLINRVRGADAPATSLEAAKDIGMAGAEAGVTTAVLGAAGKMLPSQVTVAKGMQQAGKAIAAPHSVKRTIGKAIQAAGKAIEPSDAPKVVITARDYLRIQELMKQGISQGDAVRTVMNLKVRGAI